MNVPLNGGQLTVIENLKVVHGQARIEGILPVNPYGYRLHDPPHTSAHRQAMLHSPFDVQKDVPSMLNEHQ